MCCWRGCSFLTCADVRVCCGPQAVKQQRSSSAGPPAAEATGSAGGAPVPQPGTPGKAPAAAPQNAVSDAELAVPPPDVLQNASVQQLMTYADNALSSALQVCAELAGGGGCACPHPGCKAMGCLGTMQACRCAGTCHAVLHSPA